MTADWKTLVGGPASQPSMAVLLLVAAGWALGGFARTSQVPGAGLAQTPGCCEVGEGGPWDLEDGGLWGRADRAPLQSL